MISGTEHQRIIQKLSSGDVVYDMFAGIGPFAVPAAKKRCTVFANDLNPQSYEWLNCNQTLNKVKTPAKTFNLDGRQFVKEVVRADLTERWGTESDKDYQSHVIMNLPAMALEFLDVFPGLLADFDSSSLRYIVCPTVYCYCFSKSEDPEQDVRERAEASLGGIPLPPGYIIRNVRNVAPGKNMFCLTFTLMEDLLFGQEPTAGGGSRNDDDGTLCSLVHFSHLTFYAQ